MSDASQPGPVPGPPLPPDFQGAADHMVYVYDSASNGPALAAVVPIRTSDQATEAGRMLVANGLDFADYPGAPLLAGPGSPSSADGIEGCFWLDRSTGRVFGPKGESVPGVWPTMGRKALYWHEGRHHLEGPWVVGPHTLDAQPGIPALRVTNFGAGPSSPQPNHVGLELVVGSDVSVPGGLGWVTLRPQGSHPGSPKNLRLGGHAGGQVQDLQGQRFLVESDRPLEFLHGAPAKVVLGGGIEQAWVGLLDPLSQGSWSSGLNGWAVPQDGQYRARLHCQITTAAGRGGIRAQILIDGALPAQGARTMEGWVGSEQPESLELEARYVLQAGQSLGFRVQRRNGSVSVTEGLGTISFERIA